MKNQFNYLTESCFRFIKSNILWQPPEKPPQEKTSTCKHENQKNLIYYFTKFLKPVTLDYIYSNP